jgi:hypothetical protein
LSATQQPRDQAENGPADHAYDHCGTQIYQDMRLTADLVGSQQKDRGICYLGVLSDCHSHCPIADVNGLGLHYPHGPIGDFH